MSADPDSVVAHAAASSTTPLEAAVVLESGGVTDRVAADRYRAADVFSLAVRSLADPDRGVSEPAARPVRRVWSTVGDPRWLRARGVLYAVPALVAISLLPGEDPASMSLVLGGLLLTWAAGYGIASIAWAYLGNLDRGGAQRFLRYALLLGTLLAFLASTVGVFAALILTSTTSVDLSTILLLTGQSAYLLAAATLLLCGKEAWLLVALVPGATGAVLGLLSPRDAPISALGAVSSGSVRYLWWPAVSVVLAVVSALVATRGARRPKAPLPGAVYEHAVAQAGQGLFVAVLVVFPALDQLVAPGYDPLPLSVTLVALPLVLGMGWAEWLLLEFREHAAALLASTRSRAQFARAARIAALRAHLHFAGALAGATVLFVSVVAVTSTGWPIRLSLLGLDYLVLGVALFSASMATALGRSDRVLAVLAAGMAALSAFLVRGQQVPVSSTMTIVWHTGTGTALLAVLGLVVWRTVGVPVRHR